MTTTTNPAWLTTLIRDVPDFPKPGIMFKDITPMLLNPDALKRVISEMAAQFSGEKVDLIVGAESRGFIFGVLMAQEMGIGFIPVRKPGKLPYKKVKVSYSLEYGHDTLEVHEDAIKKGSRILIVDDLLATGGTVGACKELCEMLGGVVVGASFVIELGFLKGREKLPGVRVESLVNY
jgi:adenine phosphoribosyltransferase